MPRADRLRAKFPGRLERRDPLADIAIAHIVVRSIYANIACKENLLLRQPRDGVPMRMCHAQVHQLDTMFTIVEIKLLGKQNAGRFQPRPCKIGTNLRLTLPSSAPVAVVAGLAAPHLFYHARMRNRDAAILHEHLVPIRMVAVVMRIESKTNGLVGDRADLADHQLRACGIVGVDHEHIILEDHPPVVADGRSIVRNNVSLVKINVRGYPVRFSSLRCSRLNAVGKDLSLARDTQKCSPLREKFPPIHLAHTVSSNLNVLLLSFPMKSAYFQQFGGIIRSKLGAY